MTWSASLIHLATIGALCLRSLRSRSGASRFRVQVSYLASRSSVPSLPRGWWSFLAECSVSFLTRSSLTFLQSCFSVNRFEDKEISCFWGCARPSSSLTLQSDWGIPPTSCGYSLLALLESRAWEFRNQCSFAWNGLISTALAWCSSSRVR